MILKFRVGRYYDVADIICDEGGKSLRKRVAFSKSGEYIGTPERAKELYRKYGIEHFEKADIGDAVCSIGYSPRMRKWFGWSDVLVCGFGVGSKVTEGDMGYRSKEEGGRGIWVAETSIDAKIMAIDFAKAVS